MEKIKNKIFWLIFVMLTIFLISILCIFNYQDYSHEKREIENNLMRAQETRNEKSVPNSELEQIEETDKKEPPAKPDADQQKEPIFIDIIAYTVIYDENNEVQQIINHTQLDVSENEVKEIAEKILKESKHDNTKVGNLYFDNYSYSFNGQNTLTIIDNGVSHEKIVKLLITSIIIFVLAEIIILLVSIKITSWIIKPVIDTFNKQKQFIADASHELKTPVAVILANAEALEKEPNEAKWLNNIKSESERMNELISDLLDLAKLESGKNKSQYSMADLSKICEKTVLTFESLIYEKSISLNYQIQENIMMKCNSSQIKQLIAILIDNAIQHSEPNGEINIILEERKNNILLEVSNKGKEIPKEMQDKIFERFYRVDEARTRGENRYGLGLAIAKNIVNNHDGEITVRCEKGYTIFSIKMKK